MLNPSGSTCFKNEHRLSHLGTIRGLIYSLLVVR
jgi:hypothetical protein